MFYFVRQDLLQVHDMIEVVGHTDVTGALFWTMGVKFDNPVPRETLLLDPQYGTQFPDLFDTTIPLMSQRLIDAFHALGVDNFDIYPMLLKRQDTGQEFEGYSAINVLGSVDAVDKASSPHRLRFGKPHFTGSITIDPARTRGLETFRLTYGPDFIVVSERIAKQLQAGNFQALLIQPTTDFDGN